MLSLHYKSDDDIIVEGKVYALNMAYDNILRYTELTQDKTLTEQQRTVGVFVLMLGEFPDLENVALYEEVIKVFNDKIGLNRQEVVRYDIQGNELPAIKKEQQQTFSFIHDADYIYSSFMQAYSIDLIEQRGKLHWDKFNALLNGLPEDTMFKKIIDIRTRELPRGKNNTKERKELQRLKEIYKLPEGSEE